MFCRQHTAHRSSPGWTHSCCFPSLFIYSWCNKNLNSIENNVEIMFMNQDRFEKDLLCAALGNYMELNARTSKDSHETLRLGSNYMCNIRKLCAKYVTYSNLRVIVYSGYYLLCPVDQYTYFYIQRWTYTFDDHTIYTLYVHVLSIYVYYVHCTYSVIKA